MNKENVTSTRNMHFLHSENIDPYVKYKDLWFNKPLYLRDLLPRNIYIWCLKVTKNISVFSKEDLLRKKKIYLK